VELDKPTVLDPHELLWKARRYLWKALLPIVVMMCGAFVYLRLTVPLYESSIVITMGERGTMGTLEPLVRPDRDREAAMANVAGVQGRIRNRTFLERLVQRLGLLNHPSILRTSALLERKNPTITREEHAMRLAVSVLESKIAVAPYGTTGNVRIGAWDTSGEEARRLAVAIGEELIEDTQRGTLEKVHARGEFSEDQIAVYSEKVRRSEGELRAYQESVIGQKASTGPVNATNIDRVRQLVDAAGDEIDQVRGRIRTDQESWPGLAGPSAPAPTLRSSAIADAESQLTGMETSYCMAAVQAPLGSAELATRQTQIGVARRELLGLYENAARAMGGNLSSDARALAAGMALDRAVLRSVQARQDRLNGLVNSYLNVERSGPREQLELDRLRSEVQTNRDLLAALQREANSSRLSAALESSQLSPPVEIVEPPMLPLSPIWPNWQKILAGAFALGAVLSVGLIIASERVGAIIRTVGQVEEELGAKVIGTIPRIEGWSRPGSYLANHWAPLSIVVVLLLTALVSLVKADHAQAPPPPATTSSEFRR